MGYWGIVKGFEFEREVIRIPVRQINQAIVSLSGTDGLEWVEGGDSYCCMRQVPVAAGKVVNVLE